MNLNLNLKPGAPLGRCAALVACGLLLGCLPEKKVVWSPDGRQAAVLAGEDLFLCGPQGDLSPAMMTAVAGFAWLPDSASLVVTRYVTHEQWSGLAAELTDEQTQGVIRLAGEIKQNPKAAPGQEKQPAAGDSTLAGALLYLKEKDEAAYEIWARENKKEGEKLPAQLYVTQVMRMETPVKPGVVLGKSLACTAEIRPSPSGKTVAWVNRTNALFVAPTDGSHAPALVEPKAAQYPDWTPDSRTLAYIRPTSENEINLGILCRRALVDEAGRLVLTNATEDLAGLLFDGTGKVRCLRDGRLLFTGADLHLPLTAKDMPQREQLFALDPGRYVGVVRVTPREAADQMPAKGFSFEVSPDDQLISMEDTDGRIVILRLADGSLTTVQSSRSDKSFKFIPTWRSADELCFGVVPDKNAPAGGPNSTRGVALWKAGETRVLSHDWPAEVLNRVQPSE